MRLRLLALASFFVLTLSAHADFMPSQYSVSVNCCGSGSFGGTQSGFVSINGVGVVPFSAYLTSTTANFQVGTQVYGPVNTAFTLTNVDFYAQETDHITGFTLQPSSTIAGIVPSTYIQTAPVTYTHIDFDFSNVTVTPGSQASFGLSFTPQAAPEIDPSLASSGLILIGGTIVILRGRRVRPTA